MYRRYYDGYNTYEGNRSAKPQEENGEVVVPETAEVSQAQAELPCTDESIHIEDGVAAVHTAGHGGTGLSGIFGRLELDDILLIGVIILLLHDSVEDTLLIAVLAVILLAGWLD